MSIAERLEEMRCGIPGCSLVSFGDLSTGLALRTSAQRQHKQDYLEGILQQAAQNFAVSDLLCAEDGRGEKSGHRVIIATPHEVRIFVRSQESISDVVCCVCDSVELAAPVTGYAQKIFLEVSGDA